MRVINFLRDLVTHVGNVWQDTVDEFNRKLDKVEDVWLPEEEDEDDNRD